MKMILYKKDLMLEWLVKKQSLLNTIARDVSMFGLLNPVWEDSRLTLSLRIRKGEWCLADAFESFVNKAMITVCKRH